MEVTTTKLLLVGENGGQEGARQKAYLGMIDNLLEKAWYGDLKRKVEDGPEQSVWMKGPEEEEPDQTLKKTMIKQGRR